MPPRKKKQIAAAILAGLLALGAILFPAAGPVLGILGGIGQAVIEAAPTPTLPETGPEAQGGQDSGVGA